MGQVQSEPRTVDHLVPHGGMRHFTKVDGSIHSLTMPLERNQSEGIGVTLGFSSGSRPSRMISALRN
jgi:hypothetical protein